MKNKVPSVKLEQSRNLRKSSTVVEKKLWQLLKNRRLSRYKFRRQHVIAPYIVDFVCLEKKLIIELDGGQHATNENYDQNRTDFLKSHGYSVMRFWNNIVFKQTEDLLMMILSELEK